jgi:hypothetical protein
MARIWLGMALCLALATPALADQAALRAEAEPTGKLYLDESYMDEDGRLHIVISTEAMLQFTREWPEVSVPLNVVSMQQPAAACGQRSTVTGTAAAQPSPYQFEVPGMGSFDMLDSEFMDQVREARLLAPEAFDEGFRAGWEESLASADPREAAVAEQLIPMSEGLSVPEALDRAESILDVFRTISGTAASE